MPYASKIEGLPDKQGGAEESKNRRDQMKATTHWVFQGDIRMNPQA
jgi:hypothetical protein